MRNMISPHADRIAKLSQAVNNLTSTTSTERSFRVDNLEEKLRGLEARIEDSTESLMKQFSSIKEQVADLSTQVDRDRSKTQQMVNEKYSQVVQINEKLEEQIEQQTLSRREMEAKIARGIDEKFSITSTDLFREVRGNFEEIQDKQASLRNQLSPLISHTNEISTLQDDLEKQLAKQLTEEVGKIREQMNNEKTTREETEEALLQMLKDVVGHLKADLENERKSREETEEHLLKLLEDTCNKVSQI